MNQSKISSIIEKLLHAYEAGELMLMQTVNRLYDLERDYKLTPQEIAQHVSDEDIKDNYLSIHRK